MAYLYTFFENETHAALVAFIRFFIEDDSGDTLRMLYGILDKKSNKWNWFYMKENELPLYFNLKYMDNTALYFVAEPAEMKESGLSKRFPELDQMSDYDNVIIIKCSLKN